MRLGNLLHVKHLTTRFTWLICLSASLLPWGHALSLLSLYVSHGKRANLVPRGRDPFGQRRGSGPLGVVLGVRLLQVLQLLQPLQVSLCLLGYSHYSTDSGGRWPGTFWAVLHQVLPTSGQMGFWVRKSRTSGYTAQNQKWNPRWRRSGPDTFLEGVKYGLEKVGKANITLKQKQEEILKIIASLWRKLVTENR